MLAARLLLMRCLAHTAFLLLIAWEKANLGGHLLRAQHR